MLGAGAAAHLLLRSTEIILSLAQNCGFCRQGVPAALFRENALLHYQAYCAANRDVILSRRACGVSKNLLRLPQSSRDAIMPAFIYTNSIVTPQDPSTSRLATLGTPLRMTGRAAWRRVAAAVVCENALLHYQDCCTDSGVNLRPYTMLRSKRQSVEAAFYT